MIQSKCLGISWEAERPEVLSGALQSAGRKYYQELCRRPEYLKHRKKTGETKASSKEENRCSIADVFGVLVSAKLLLGRRAGENRLATGRLPLPKVTNSTQKSPAGRFRLPIWTGATHPWWVCCFKSANNSRLPFAESSRLEESRCCSNWRAIPTEARSAIYNSNPICSVYKSKQEEFQGVSAISEGSPWFLLKF